MALHDRITSSLRNFIALFALATCLCATTVRAQIDSLPPSENLTFSDVDKAQIQAYATKRLDAMERGLPAEREKARKELLEPLRRPGVSVAFRQILRGATIDRLTQLADNTDEEIAINSLVLLGEIADDATRQVIQQHTGDASKAVRYAAVAALIRTFHAVNTSAPALDPARVSQAVAHLGERLTVETDPNVADAITRALLQASNISRNGYAAAAADALARAAAGVGARLRHADETARPIALVTCVRVGDALSSRLAAAGNTPSETARAAAGFGGEMLAFLAFHAKQGDLPPDARRWEIDLTNLAERAIVLAHSRLGGGMSAPGLAAMLEANRDTEFYDRTRALVLSLSGPPWSLSAEPMQRIRDALDGK